MLTADGHVYFAAKSAAGEFLFSKKDEAGRFSIWLRRREGAEQRLTDGATDVSPSFSPNGREWPYADYKKVRTVDFVGKYFKSRGPLNTVPSPQHKPTILHAGASPRGAAVLPQRIDLHRHPAWSEGVQWVVPAPSAPPRCRRSRTRARS